MPALRRAAQVYYWRALRLIFRYPLMIGICAMVFTVRRGQTIVSTNARG